MMVCRSRRRSSYPRTFAHGSSQSLAVSQQSAVRRATCSAISASRGSVIFAAFQNFFADDARERRTGAVEKLAVEFTDVS